MSNLDNVGSGRAVSTETDSDVMNMHARMYMCARTLYVLSHGRLIRRTRKSDVTCTYSIRTHS